MGPVESLLTLSTRKKKYSKSNHSIRHKIFPVKHVLWRNTDHGQVLNSLVYKLKQIELFFKNF